MARRQDGHVAVIVGTRPELIKMAPVLRALRRSSVPFRFVHTGQHYDHQMSRVFLEELGLPAVDSFLGVGSGTQAGQTAQALVAIERELTQHRPRIALVQGDTNTVLAGALAAVKLGVPVGHVEAGLRSHDLRMPEEHNRRVADHLATHLYAPTRQSAAVLRRERVTGRILVTGNTVIDAVNQFAPQAARHATVPAPRGPFALATAHRAENVDDPKVLASLVRALTSLPIPVLYPIHPRTQARLRRQGLWAKLTRHPNVTALPPLGYFELLHLMMRCRVILTDSGGLQEEATAPTIRKPVFVLRRSTERPEAVQAGFATVVGTQSARIVRAVHRELDRPRRLPARSPYGDGHAAERIVRSLPR